ncbi:dihydrodipicolinate synthase family protein [Trabulsiella odontotermitis]|uniref:2-keto-3-deoxy-galactonate aldolase n=1 Tax=Trabulsiella odontotermitis TaxID=379893 RepID=A0A0L0GTD1_9ENTR|nr:dihydrodipicolinate synthase family protein [Trabulsiella odontotermitis]KNC91698.1 2-keto-3-deoxy-galactonate aldolase [Trabulsiella odontotermitis]KNC92072.1 2-keto-3-deoxy-galactonate aldolase [Trabulsiella odontotermitis]
MKKFRGIIPPVSSTFDRHGAIDNVAMKHVADFLINKGVDGLFYLGTGGEFSQMNASQRMAFTEAAVSVVDGRVPVLIGVGSPSTEEAVKLARHAEACGADGIVAINPYYWKVASRNLDDYYHQIAHSVELPVIIYNFPDLTGQDLTPEIVKRLVLQNDNIVGIKDTIDSVGHLRTMINTVKAVRPDFSVFCGFDDHLLNTLLLGGDGAITASANFAPELSVGIYRAWQAGDLALATSLNKRLLQLPSIYALETPFVSLIKHAMQCVGLPVETYCLPPILEASEEAKGKVHALLVAQGIVNA